MRTLLLAGAAALAFSASAAARDTIRIVGSSTVFPFSTAVAEQYGARPGVSTPVVEQTGTGGGFELFCAGVGPTHPDIVNASRRIKPSEFEMCLANGVDDIVEVKIGYDGIVFANAKSDPRAPEFSLSRRQVFQALAANLPASNDDCTLAPNANVLWSDIDPSLPAERIEVFGPPPTSGTRDAFVEIAMEGGARTYACLSALRNEDSGAFRAVAHRLREDGAWIDAGENDNALVNSILKAPTSLAVFGFSFLEQNSDRVRGARIDGAEPTFESIASGEYNVSRSLYFYLKKDHVGLVPGLEGFAAEFTSEGTWDSFGYLAEKGLIPLPDEDRAEISARVASLETLTAADLMIDDAGPEHAEPMDASDEAAVAGDEVEAGGEAQ